MIPFWTLYSRDLKRSWRVRGQTYGAPLVSAVLYLLIFGISIGSYIDLSGETSYLSFLIPGLIMMAALSNSMENASSSLLVSKYHGDLQALRTSPLNSHQIVWGISLGGATRGLILAIGVAVIGELFSFIFYREWIPVTYPPIALLFLVLAAVSLGLLGVGIGFLARSFDQMSAFSSFLFLPLIYLGGVFFPLDRLPHFWQTISRFNPILYYISGLRFGLLGSSDVDPLLSAVISCGGLLCGMGLAYWQVRRGRNYQL